MFLCFSRWGGRATRLPFSPKIRESTEVAPHTFLFRRKSASRHFCVWGRATRLPFSLTTRVARGQQFCLKRHPMWFFVSKRHPMWSKTRAQHEKHASKNASKTRAPPAPDDTAPAPFSPSPVCDRWLEEILMPCVHASHMHRVRSDSHGKHQQRAKHTITW